jgi:hypothetical protein
MELVLRWGVRNVRFGVWDILKPPPAKFDAVTSTEVLEHIRDARRALTNQLTAARRFVYTLVPYATDAENSDAEKRLNAYLNAEHLVCGFEPSFFDGLSANRVTTHGVYWKCAGFQFRKSLIAAADAEIEGNCISLFSQARNDIINDPPRHQECFGLKAILTV